MDPWTTCNVYVYYAQIRIACAWEKQDTLACVLICSTLRVFHTYAQRVDTQYVAHVSHVRAATTKGDSPLEEISI